MSTAVKPISEIAYLEFWVPGRPAPQGSKNPFRRGNRIILVESCKSLPAWRKAVTKAAGDCVPSDWPMHAAYDIQVSFLFERPKAHYLRGRLRQNAPIFHVTRPDGDKLSRAILDSLTGVTWKDDSQAAIGRWEKRYVPISDQGVGTWDTGAYVRIKAF